MKELDLLALRTLADKVNVIPVIAKADTLTPIEKAKFKALVWSDIQKHEIPIYPHAISTEELGGLEVIFYCYQWLNNCLWIATFAIHGYWK